MTPTLAAVFAALGSEPRLKILDLLAGGPMAVADIAVAIAMTQGGASNHLRILRLAGLVDYTRTGWNHHFHATPLAADLVGHARAALAGGGEKPKPKRKK